MQRGRGCFCFQKHVQMSFLKERPLILWHLVLDAPTGGNILFTSTLSKSITNQWMDGVPVVGRFYQGTCRLWGVGGYRRNCTYFIRIKGIEVPKLLYKDRDSLAVKDYNDTWIAGFITPMNAPMNAKQIITTWESTELESHHYRQRIFSIQLIFFLSEDVVS